MNFQEFLTIIDYKPRYSKSTFDTYVSYCLYDKEQQHVILDGLDNTSANILVYQFNNESLDYLKQVYNYLKKDYG